MTASEVDRTLSLKQGQLGRSTYFCRSCPPFMAQMGTTTFCLLYPSDSTWIIDTSSFLAVGIRIAIFTSNLWLGFTLVSLSSSSSMASTESSGAQLYSLLDPVRVQDQRYSSSILLPPITPAIVL